MKKILEPIYFISVFLVISGCSSNVGTVQTVLPISNSCYEDTDCSLVPPVIECPSYECGSCDITVIDNSSYISVNTENYYQYRSTYVKERQCGFDLSKVPNCPACVTIYEYTENIQPKCINNLCTIAESDNNVEVENTILE